MHLKFGREPLGFCIAMSGLVLFVVWAAIWPMSISEPWNILIGIAVVALVAIGLGLIVISPGDEA